MLDGFGAVNESITINRCDNGWVVDVDGEIDNNWKSVKMICISEEELFGILKEWNELKLTT